MALSNNPNGTILTFGELFLRIALDGQGGWLKQKKIPFFLGGAELNVASALALWGLPVRYFTALPDNYMSREIAQQLESENINTFFNSILRRQARTLLSVGRTGRKAR